MNDSNPYAPPAGTESFVPENLPSWEIDGIGLLVRDGTVLPRIDLETGDEDPELVERKRKAVKGHWFLSLISLVAPSFQFIPKSLRTWEGIPFWLPMVIFFGIWLIAYLLIITTMIRRMTFVTYVDPAVEARRSRKKHLQMALYALSIGLMIAPLVIGATSSFSLGFTNIIGGVIAGTLGMLAVSLWQYYDRPKIHTKAQSDGRIRLGGIHPAALRRLETWKATQSQRS